VARLTETDASRLNGALSELYAVVPLAEFPARALAVAGELIGCVHCSYNEIDIASAGHLIVVDPPELLFHEAAPRFEHLVHQHPVIAHYAVSDDPASHLISDFLTPPEFRRLELYNEFFRPLETEAQLSNTLSAGGGRYVIGLAFNRGCEGFTDRDRHLLDLLRPHLQRSHSNAAILTAALAASLPTEESRAATLALARLTDRQRDVLALVAQGQTNAQIALHLGISPLTAKTHVEQILRRLDLSTRTEAAALYLTATATPGTAPTTSHPDKQA
jgi:DNA-binding CsgD family transcriptional regulator